MVAGGVSVFVGGHAWLWGAYVVEGACMAVGGMHGCGGREWLWGGVHEIDEIRSISGGYASYWNVFLFQSAIKTD